MGEGDSEDEAMGEGDSEDEAMGEGDSEDEAMGEGDSEDEAMGEGDSGMCDGSEAWVCVILGFLCCCSRVLLPAPGGTLS
ncbi:hypothetical protein CesoFtcFv8_010860 [Champsocephalus esox]|uniref:Uncharacterized protein n=1 Tax=Champsocephalus esox TaxID=159716 RepID=A0AAN8C196_9TELE|nr:hypothetical protein CesoFtcFv8_010860 [Champsocephalus esox]